MHLLSEYFLICLMSTLKSFSVVMFALAFYLRDIAQVPLSVCLFSAWIAFSAFLIFFSGCKVSLYLRFGYEGMFSCRLLVHTFTWLVACQVFVFADGEGFILVDGVLWLHLYLMV